MPPKKSSHATIGASKKASIGSPNPSQKASQTQSPTKRASVSPSTKVARLASRMLRDPNFDCRTGIYDQLREKCAANTAACKGVRDDGMAHSYADCEKFGASSANLLTNFPTTSEDNKRLQEKLRAEKNSGDPSKAQYDLGKAKRCLTQLWWTPEQGKARLEVCAPPKRISHKKSMTSPPSMRVSVPKTNSPKSTSKSTGIGKRSIKAPVETLRPFF